MLEVEAPGVYAAAFGGFEQRAEQRHLHCVGVEHRHRLEGLVLGLCYGDDRRVVGGGGLWQGLEVPLLQPGAPLHELAMLDGNGGFGRAHEGDSLQHGRGVDEVAEGLVDARGAYELPR